ncbi:MAG: glycosyltransferase family 4 protein [Chloroflexi bacterium]|nr:glycosyltransferase family 4 protein [Chloroflexota bacterium]
MRILMLSDYLPPHVGGGVEQVVDQLSTQLVRRGHEVRVLSLRTRPAPLTEIRDGVEIERVRATDLTGLIGLQVAWSWRIYKATWDAVRGFSPDVIHAHNLFFRTTESIAIPFMLNGTKLVTTVHLGKVVAGGAGLKAITGLHERFVGRWIIRRSDRLIAVSLAVAEHARSLGAKADRIDVIPNGVDLQVFKPPARPREGAPRILFVGRLVPNKGPEVLVRAAPAVLEKHPDAQFVICGDGPMRGSLEREVASRNIAHAFKFLGLIHDVPELMRGGTVLVRPSTLEGMPLSVLEAMASGLPVVATRVGGTPELVKHGTHGFLFEPGDVSGLAQHLLVLLGNRRLAAEFGAAGRRAVESGWSWSDMAVHTEATYERALSQRASP